MLLSYASVKRSSGVLAVPLLVLLLELSACQPNADSPATATVSGTIETDEAHVASRIGGRVIQIHAQEGDTLKPGQLLVELEAPDLPAHRAQLAAQLDELVAGPRVEEIAAAKHDWEAAVANLDFARSDSRRADQLFAQKTIAENERDQLKSRADALEKTAAAAKSRYDLLLAGTRPERIALVRAQIAELDTQIRELQILSPTNSTLEVLSVKVGDVLAPNREAATLLFTDHLWIRVFAPQTWLGYLQIGDNVTVKTDSLGTRAFQGTIEQIARAAEFTPRNVQTRDDRIRQVYGIKVRLKNDDGTLKAGMTAEVTFPKVPAGK